MAKILTSGLGTLSFITLVLEFIPATLISIIRRKNSWWLTPKLQHKWSKMLEAQGY